jgi:hypothetical protein
LLGALEIALGDTEQIVHVPADLAPPSEEGFAPADRIVVPLALVRSEAVAGDRIEYALRQPRLGVTGNHPDAPGLNVATAGASAREPKQFLDRGPPDRLGKERADGLARADGFVHGGDGGFTRHLDWRIIHR